jgi:hypothetical protein
MGNKISIVKNESEEDKDKRIYEYAKKLKLQFEKDLISKSINFTEFSEKMDLVERFIEYYETEYK